MIFRFTASLVLMLSLAACQTAQKKKANAEKQPNEKAVAEANNDVSYQAFVGRLRKAVAARDVSMLASMMTPNFGYRLSPPGEGEGVFSYWDEKGLWPELQAILNERFAPSGNFMVAPPQFAMDPDYHGYRAGITQVNGSWKFAYFVTD